MENHRSGVSVILGSNEKIGKKQAIIEVFWVSGYIPAEWALAQLA
jgi:hypothetical protein